MRGMLGVSSRTVRRATDILRRLGLLLWQTRLVRAGWRTEQTSNAYLLVPTAENPAVLCDGQIGRQILSKRFKTVATGLAARLKGPSGARMNGHGGTVTANWRCWRAEKGRCSGKVSGPQLPAP
jgi:hypothetical protein